VLWSGGISFAGVMAFIYADLIVLPIIFAYRKYYGTSYALRISALMYVTMVIAAILIDLLFRALGLIPDTRPTTSDVFGSIEVDYKLVLNIVGLVIFASLWSLTVRRGVVDPVCGMSVDKGKAKTAEFEGRTFHLCSDHCRATFEADPARYAHGAPHAERAEQAHAQAH
jgi:YHS domain-containing protein